MANKTKFKGFRRFLYEVFTLNGGSVLRYRGKDEKFHYVVTSDKADTTYLTEHQSIKTINGTTMTGSGNVLTAPAVVGVSGVSPTQVLSPNTFYFFSTVNSLSGISLATPTDGIVNIYAFSFTAGADDIDPIAGLTGVTWANGFEPDLSSGDYCEVSIMNGIATFIASTPADNDETLNPGTEETT